MTIKCISNSGAELFMITVNHTSERIRRATPFAFALLVVAGCAPAVQVTTVEQESGPREQNCQVVMFREGRQERPEGTKIGSIEVGDTGFSINCSAEKVNRILRERACAAGADVVYVKNWKLPSFASSCYRAQADFYKIPSSNWPALDSSREDVILDLNKKLSEGSIHPLEGIWTDKEGEYEIAIVRDSQRESVDFLAVVLEAYRYPWWKPMEVKAEITNSALAGVFEIRYYRADRSMDATSGTFDEAGLLTIRLQDAGAGGSIDSIWFRKYPPTQHQPKYP